MTNKKYISSTVALLLLSIICISCAETFQGVGRDARRVSQGLQTVFISDS